MKEATSEFKIVEEPKKPLAMNPKKFAMWLFLASVGMLFAAFTSAYIVRRAEGNWVYFELPTLFYYTTAIILASSITMQAAYFAAKKDRTPVLRTMLSITAVFGVIFLVGQVYAWGQLLQIHIHMVGNVSGSFVYLLTGLHGLHLISAIIFLLVVVANAWRGRIRSGHMAQMEMCTTYWHFLSVLWVYLFIFLLASR